MTKEKEEEEKKNQLILLIELIWFAKNKTTTTTTTELSSYAHCHIEYSSFLRIKKEIKNQINILLSSSSSTLVYGNLNSNIYY